MSNWPVDLHDAWFTAGSPRPDTLDEQLFLFLWMLGTQAQRARATRFMKGVVSRA